jgi:hypothetical protein
MRRTTSALMALGLLLLAGCSGVSAGDPQVKSSDGTVAPVASGAPSPLVSPAEFPTFEDLGPPIPRAELIGRWKVEGPGVLPETYLNLGEGFTLDQPCGELRGDWTASDKGRVSVEFSDAQLPVCITDGGRDWTRASLGQRSWGAKLVLTNEGDEPEVVLTRETTSPPVGTVEAIAARKFPKTPAAPAGYLPLDSVAGGWVRDVAGADALSGIDGININLDPRTGEALLGTGRVRLYAFGSTKKPQRAENRTGGFCSDSEFVTTLVNADGSWLPRLPGPSVLGIGRDCEPFDGPDLNGRSPVDSLRRAAAGGVDPKTKELVLLDEKGTVVQRLAPRRDLGVETQGPGTP